MKCWTCKTCARLLDKYSALCEKCGPMTAPRYASSETSPAPETQSVTPQYGQSFISFFIHILTHPLLSFTEVTVFGGFVFCFFGFCFLFFGVFFFLTCWHF